MSIYADLLTIVSRHPGITSAETLDHLESLGYYRNKPANQAIEDIAKKLSYLKHTGKLTAETRRGDTGGKVNQWTAVIPTVDPETAGDVALVIEQKPIRTRPKTQQPDVLPISSSAILRELAGSSYDDRSFIAGIAFAESFHGITRP